MKRFLLALLITMTCLTGYAQEFKSARKAMLSSLLLPGAGEMYTGHWNKASVFLSTELAIWLSYARLNQEAKWAEQNSETFASQYAHVPLHCNSDMYQLMQQYESSADYNQEIELNVRNNLVMLLNDTSIPTADREYYATLLNDPEAYNSFIAEYLMTGEHAWKWDSNDSYHQFYTMRKNRQKTIIYKNFAVSALIMNRLISMIDATVMAKKWNKGMRKYGMLSVNPDFQHKGVNLVYSFKF